MASRATLALALTAAACAGVPSDDASRGSAVALPAAELDPTRPAFREVAAETGLDFVHWNGMSGELYFPEIMGAGAALLDYDGDGDLDVFLTQGHMLGPGREVSSALVPPPAGPLRDRLYRNDLEPGPQGVPVPAFVDRTEESGIRSTGYGMGAATGDVDNDGDVDLYVTNWGENRLYLNRGDGTFRDATTESGTGDPLWSTSAAMLDYDGDGWLDIFVCNYVDFRFANHKPCFGRTGKPDYCAPDAYLPQPDRLYRNRGDGTFEDVSLTSGIGLIKGAGLGVVSADLDGDGRLDLYVANDRMPNRLWINQGDGTFRDEALLAGVAVNADGSFEASMGVDAGDPDGDGDEDLFLTHLLFESNTLYLNDGQGIFSDRTVETGLAAPSLPYTGFGTAWRDLNGDGWLDLFVANGAVLAVTEQIDRGEVYPYAERNQVFLNRGEGEFADVTGIAGPALEPAEVSRGAAFGDLDNDGDVDVVVANNSGPVRLLLNEAAAGHWLGLRLLTGRPGRDALGARVDVVLDDGGVLRRRAGTDASYCAANDPRVVVGIGGLESVREVRVSWPGGARERFTGVGVDTWTTLRSGEGLPVE